MSESDVREWLEDNSESAHRCHELELFLQTTGSLYPKRKAIGAQLARKRAAGKYDAKLAPKAWQFVVDEAAKLYAREIVHTPSAWSRMFPPDVRRAVAISKAEQWEQNAKAGRPEEV